LWSIAKRAIEALRHIEARAIPTALSMSSVISPKQPASGPATPRKGLAALLTVIASCGLSGCLEATRPADVAIATPASFTEARHEAAPPLALDWPRLFRSAELTRLAQTAQLGSFDIAAAVARIRQAEANLTLASVAPYPTLSTSDNASRSQSSGTLRSKNPPFFTSVSNRFSLGLNASYEIDFWGRNRDRAEAAQWQLEASRFDRDTVALSTAASVTNNYFVILASQDRLRIAREDLRIAERVLAGIRGRLQVGTTSGLEIAQQETVVAQQRAAIPPLEQTVRQTKNALAVLLGRTPETVHVAGGSLDRLRAPAIKPGLPSQLLLRRPDIAAAEARLIAAGGNVEFARKQFFPTITLTGNGGVESLLLSTLLRPESGFFTVGAGLTEPIFDGFSRQGQLDLEKGLRQELLEDYRRAIVSAFTDVENALIAVRLTTERERLQNAVVVASRKAYEITDQRLREGTVDILTVLNTQTALFQAQDQLVQARLSRLQAYVSLFQALGGGFTRPPEPQPIETPSLLPRSPVPPIINSADAKRPPPAAVLPDGGTGVVVPPPAYPARP